MENAKSNLWLIRLFDDHIRSNYVEGRYKAKDRLQVIEIARKDSDLIEHCKRRFRYADGFEGAIANHDFEIIALEPVETTKHQ